MRNKRTSIAVGLALVAVLFAGMTSISAQDAGSSDLVIQPPPGTPATGLPRENVTGGALVARSPGNNIAEAIRRHNAFQQTTLPYYDTQGGEPEPNQRQMFLVELLNSIFDALFGIIIGLGGAAGGA